MKRQRAALTHLSPIALCYIRQSFTRDNNDLNSPERQRANIQAVCDREGWSPLWFIDAEGHKSGRYEKNRPEWLRLKDHISDPGVVAVVANDLARLHRKAWRVGRLVDEVLEPAGIRLVLAAPGRQLDTSTPMGRMLLMMIAMQDESYANDISMRTKDNIAYRKARAKPSECRPLAPRATKRAISCPPLTAHGCSPTGILSKAPSRPNRPSPERYGTAITTAPSGCWSFTRSTAWGRERIAYQMDDEGWAFRDRQKSSASHHEGRYRRVTSNWREYAGLKTQGCAKDQNASLMENPTAVLHDTGRAVFDLELLRRVATVQEKRSETKRPRGSVKKAHPYMLARLLYCAHCERRSPQPTRPFLALPSQRA